MFYLLYYTESMDLKTALVLIHQHIILFTYKCEILKGWSQ